MERRMGEWKKKSAEVRREGRKKKGVVKDRKKVHGRDESPGKRGKDREQRGVKKT